MCAIMGMLIRRSRFEEFINAVTHAQRIEGPGATAAPVPGLDSTITPDSRECGIVDVKD